jgi:hypothetical protein
VAVTAYTRFRFLWGAVDWQQGTNNPYTGTQTASLGTSAVAAGGIGVRRCQVTIDRTSLAAGTDPATVHFDFLNITGGNPDDTWITSDYTTLEGYLDTFFTAYQPYMAAGLHITTYTWYRVGAGVTKPNPNVRQLVKTTPIAGTATGSAMPPQVSTSVTLRTAVRHSWGRTYLPMTGVSRLTTDGHFATADVDVVAGAANTLMTSAAGSDFYWGVTSLRLSAFLNAEKVEVDNVLDIVRRRRWQQSSYRKILP